MVSWLRNIFGGDGKDSDEKTNTAEEKTTENTAQGSGEDAILTTDEAFTAWFNNLRQEQQTKEQDFRKQLESIFAQPDNAQTLTNQPAPASNRQEEGDDLSLPEDATLNDLVNVITKRVAEQVRAQLEPMLKTVAPAPSLVIESVVRENEALRSVAQEAEKIFAQLPPQHQTKETATVLMWMLKGMKSESEKRQAISEALGELVGENEKRMQSPVVLPFSQRELERVANQMGVSVDKLKRRLLDEMAKGNTVEVK